MSDAPFVIWGPAIIGVSGGRTSGKMLRRILDAHGGRLPADVIPVFANTGKERVETLEFVDRMEREWRVPIVWVERTPGGGWREVSLATAARNGEPFRQLVWEKRYLPNTAARFCTGGLKVEPTIALARSLGWDEWTNVIGLRHDEPKRVAAKRDENNVEATRRLLGDPDALPYEHAMPLAAARVTKADVAAFWAAQPFDLGLEWWESNCDGCFLKGEAILERTERDRPGTLDWWAHVERSVGATFRKGRTYLNVIENARRPTLPGLLDEDGDAGVSCACTDRKPKPRRPHCTCGTRTRQHSLACIFARADAEAA